MIVFYIFFVLIFILLVFHLCTRQYVNKYKLILTFGKKGAGKSCLLTKLAFQYRAKGWTVYSTERTPGTYYFTPDQIGVVKFKPHSVVLIDEVSLIWSNRDFKNFKREVEEFFRLQRHDKLRVYLFSQTFDVDKKIRDLVDEMFLITNVARVFSYGKRISKHAVLTYAEADRPSAIAENLSFDSFLLFWAGSRFFTFIPKYVKYFDSFRARPLKEVDFPYVEIPDLKKQKRISFCKRTFKLRSRFRSFFKKLFARKR